MSRAVAVWTVLSPILIVAGALVLVLLERRFPYDRRQRFFRDGLWGDLIGYTFVQSYFLGLVIAEITAAIDRATGLSRHHLVGSWPVVAQVAFFLVTHDLYIYLFHRLQHRSPLLWRIHEAHHATADVDWLSGSRSHALEILVNQTIEFAPILLLGASPEVALIKVTLDALWGMYIHANIDVRSGRLQRVINGPEMHRWHHAIELDPDWGPWDGPRAHGGINFSTKFAFWDWLFGTAYLPAEKPSAYGLAAGDFPPNFVGQQLYAFRPWSSRQRSNAGSTSIADSKQLASPSTATAPKLRTAWLWERRRAR
jgi:sterol desaturase/sphingolipid hydroxylase (fatty acid hydroxylase superfamily)